MDAEAVLLIELDGLKDGMERLAERIIEICKKNNAREVKAAKTEAERTQLWAGRKELSAPLPGFGPTIWFVMVPFQEQSFRRF